MYVYDFKFSDLSTIAYNHLLNHPEGYKVKPKFYVINFDDPRRSHPIGIGALPGGEQPHAAKGTVDDAVGIKGKDFHDGPPCGEI